MYDSVSVFTQAATNEFAKSIEAYVAKPAPAEIIFRRANSTGAAENHAYLSPTPGISKYEGVRRLGDITAQVYSVINDDFDAAFRLPINAINDGQAVNFTTKAAELGGRAANFPARRVLYYLSQGASLKCFDGSNFFADSHNKGTGDNAITATGSGAAGTYYIAALIVDTPLKPLFWQDREKFSLYNDEGSKEAEYRRYYRYWVHGRGGVGFGYWWDAIKVTVSGLPTAAEFFDILNKIKYTFMGFKLPSFSSGEQGEYVHEQCTWGASTLVLVCDPIIGQVAEVVSKADLINNTTNTQKGDFSVIKSNYMSSMA